MKKRTNNKGMMIIGIIILVGLVIGGLFFFSPCNSSCKQAANQHNQETVYTCSMHPEVQQDEPGSCPICGMDLIPIENMEAEHMEAEHMVADTTYTCSMHPEVQQDEPGSCPICGMDLIPMETTETP